MIEEDKLRQRMERLAELVRRLDAEADPNVKTRYRELIEAVMDFHGEALDRVLQRLRGAGEAGETILDSLAADPVVSGVLLLYGLHPQDLETRVRRAIENVSPTLRSYGTGAELGGVKDGAVRIRVRGVDNAFTARTIKSAIEDELFAAVPDATSLVLLGLEKFASPDFVPLENILPGTAVGAGVDKAGGL